MGISIFSIIGLAIISAMLCLLLKQYRPEFALSATLICGIVIFLTVIAEMTPLFDMIRTTLDKIQGGNEYTMVIIKALGICYITQLASDTCQDAGERAMAGKIELAGRVAVLLLSLPMFSSILQIALELIG
ncbi:MAG: SpoIIIAC/SpoIIIAD family protein [Oscillospiraceae bacterium]|jgi:stage III sporulation protein AD